MHHHIDEVVQLGGFETAKWYSRNPQDEGSFETGKMLWTIHYSVKDRETLDSYLKNHAPKLRQNGLDLFPGKFGATRRVLELL